MNAEQKKRIAHEISNWRNARNDHSAQLTGDRMAALLQELVDAPEPEPVARVTGYYAGYLSIATVDGRVLPAGTALYAAPPHQSEHHLEMVNTPAPADVVRRKECERWLQSADLEWLVIFGMQADDCDADGHTLSKDRVRRLCELGVLRSVGFGRCEMTAFGHALFDEHWEQGITLPLRTHAEHNAAMSEKGGA